MSEGTQTARKGGRDALGLFCFVLHLVLVAYAALGWLLPSRTALTVYLAYLPMMCLQWRFNQGSCILNNLENLIREGRWRNPSNREEGAFLKTLLEDSTGLTLTKSRMNLIIYCLVSIFWILGFAQLNWPAEG